MPGGFIASRRAREAIAARRRPRARPSRTLAAAETRLHATVAIAIVPSPTEPVVSRSRAIVFLASSPPVAHRVLPEPLAAAAAAAAPHRSSVDLPTIHPRHRPLPFALARESNPREVRSRRVRRARSPFPRASVRRARLARHRRARRVEYFSHVRRRRPRAQRADVRVHQSHRLRRRRRRRRARRAVAATPRRFETVGSTPIHQTNRASRSLALRRRASRRARSVARLVNASMRSRDARADEKRRARRGRAR